jgi:carboxypeptidase family protein
MRSFVGYLSVTNTASSIGANLHPVRAVRTLLALVALMLYVAGHGFAQVETGEITGTVTDQSGAVVPGATVAAKNLASDAERTTQSSAAGTYVLVGLQPGTYQVTVSAPQFQPFTAKVEVTVGGSETLAAKLAVSQSVSEVEVVADNGGVSVNTSTQELSQVVNTQQLSSLPSLTRNPYDFVVLSGNVSNGDNTTDDANSSQNLTSRGVGYAMNGQRQTGTEILLDGVENISVFSDLVGEQVPLDSVQEYSIITNNFSAEYGRASGGVVNVTTKSGTNQFHGGAWEYNRLSAYTANTYQNVANGLPKGTYTRNQFGYMVGGPILKDKLFFFQSTEWTHVRSQAVESELIPTPQFLAMTAPTVQSYFADYGATPYPITNTFTQSSLGIPTPLLQGNRTPVPASTPILGQVNFKANADAGGDYPQNTYSLLGRLDYNMSQNTQMFFRFGQQSEKLFSGTTYYSPYSQYNVGSAMSNDSALYSISHAFSPSLFSTSKVSFNRLANPSTYNAALQDVPELMFGGATAAGLQITFPGLENYMAPGAGGLPYGGPQNSVQLQEDVAWSKGRHSMHIGAQGTYLQMNIAYGAYAQAVEYLQTNLPPALQNMLDGTLQYFESAVNTQGKYPCVQNPDGSFVETPSCEVTPPLTAPSFARSYRYKDWAIYAQDSFKATPQLTLNYGVRYEHYGVQHNDNQNLDSNFYYGPGTNIFQQISDGQVEIAPQSSVGQLWAPRWGTVAPRVGFAYDIFGNGKDSIRGGFGISYERNFGNVTFNTIQNPPAYGVIQTYNTAVTTSNVGPLGTPGAAQPLPPLELRNVNQNINVAQTQFWSLALQHQIGVNSVIEVSYSGAHGVHLYDIIAGNPIGGAQAYLGAPVDCFGTTTECLTRNNAQYAAINVRGSGGESSYNAVNVKYQTQNLHNTGLSLVANYTFSHSLDDLSSAFADSSQGGSGYIGNLGYLDPRNPKLDWGSSDFDVPNRLVISPIWQTPWLKNGRKWTSEVGGGWIFDAIYTARSGTPFSAYDFTYNLNGYSGVPRIVPITPVTQHKPGATTQIGPNEFQINSIPGANDMAPFNTTLGISDFGPFPTNMTRRNTFRGPGAWNADASLTKKFNLREGMDLQFRAEAFDLFNHHNLYVNESALSVDNEPADTAAPYLTPLGIIGQPLPVVAEKGGLNSVALGGNHDERRFGQFALRFDF